MTPTLPEVPKPDMWLTTGNRKISIGDVVDSFLENATEIMRAVESSPTEKFFLDHGCEPMRYNFGRKPRTLRHDTLDNRGKV